MRDWTADTIAAAAGARLLGPAVSRGPERVVIDSREAGPGALFVGLPGRKLDGGRFAAQALSAGAWGVLVGGDWASLVADAPAAPWLVAEEPLAAVQRLATAWRRHLGATVIGVTGSTGKTSTKDLLLAVLAPHRRTVASRANYNTEIGLPLELLNAPAGTEVLVLEMAMRGRGQIAELAAIAEPDVGLIVNIGPVHLELLGSIEAIAAAKAELIAALAPGGTAIVPAGELLLAPHLRDEVHTITFGDGGDVRLVAERGERVEIDCLGERVVLDVPFPQAHLRRNLLAVVAAARAIGVTPGGRVELTFSAGRGDRVELAGGAVLLDDSYNANPLSMRAALDSLAALSAAADGAGRGRRVAVLGDMLELGPEAASFHAEIGQYAAERGVDVLVTVGPLASAMASSFDGEVHSVENAAGAAALLSSLLRPGDTVLVKGSRGVGLELVCRALAGAPAA